MPADIRYGRIYYVLGKNSETGMRGYAIPDPPTSGWQNALVIKGEKTSTIFCPYSLHSYRVPNSCSELRGAKLMDLDKDKMASRILSNWEMWHKLGFNRDYDVAALVLTEFGHAVPKFEALAPKPGQEEAKPRGGKEVVEEALRPIKKGSKRGLVAEFFLGEDLQPLREAMARLDLTRSGVLSHLFCINRDHGIGYELANDCARLIVPEGFELFYEPEPRTASPKSSSKAGGDETTSSEPKRRASGKPTETDRIKAIPAPSKRADMATFFSEMASIEEAMEKFELTRSAVLSMLHQIWKDNGIGYSLNEDGSQAQLSIPEGFTLLTAKVSKAKKKEPA